MIKNKLQNSQIETAKNSELFSWLNMVQQNSVVEITNPSLVVEAMSKTKEAGAQLPLLLTLCPAVFNLNFPTHKGQTRELVPIESSNLRVRSLFEEIIGFQISLKGLTGLSTELFLIFGDLLERGSEKMITNPNEINSISQTSIKSIREIIIDIDRNTNGLFQKMDIKTPKVRLQSGISQQGGKLNLNREQMINQFETTILDPNSELFALWSRHMKLAGEDAKFTETSWQGQKSAKTIWDRMIFLIAELTADGIFLPEMMKHLNKNIVAEPIFLASSTRPATLKMESECFGLVNQRALIPAFRNIGKWLDPAEPSPWIDILRRVF